MPQRLDASDAGFAAAFAALVDAKRDDAADVSATVAAIISSVKARGDAAVAELTAKFDRVDLSAAGWEIPAADLDAALAGLGPDLRAALDLAAARIRAFHERQKPQGNDAVDDAGVRTGVRWSPVDAAGLYVPGGRAAYPSSVLMNAIPARVAGVKRIAMVVPAPRGELDPLVVAAARLAGIEEIHRCGGAQAIAALAWGTRSIAPVDKVVGPGNAYVAAAKRLVFGRVGIDAIAGPSEVVVVADAENDPDWIAADLMAQAEHDPMAQSILMTDDAGFAARVEAAVGRLLAVLPRREIAAASWRDHGAIVVLRRLSDAPALVDRLAPEHLQLAVADPDRLAARVRHAGAIFLGRHAPEALGDYVAGPNHVLPTSRTARFASGLGVLDFMKRTTLVGADRDTLARLAPAAVALARAEGLGAHARSISVRLAKRR
jgi:histidinol dehydrogenase